MAGLIKAPIISLCPLILFFQNSVNGHASPAILHDIANFCALENDSVEIAAGKRVLELLSIFEFLVDRNGKEEDSEFNSFPRRIDAALSSVSRPVRSCS